jgi:hypothetical protein
MGEREGGTVVMGNAEMEWKEDMAYLLLDPGVGMKAAATRTPPMPSRVLGRLQKDILDSWM